MPFQDFCQDPNVSFVFLWFVLKKIHHSVMNLHEYLQHTDFNTTHNPILWEHVNVVIKAMTQLSNKHLEWTYLPNAQPHHPFIHNCPLCPNQLYCNALQSCFHIIYQEP